MSTHTRAQLLKRRAEKRLVTHMEATYEQCTLNPVPTAADRFWFNACRGAVGIVVFGLTALSAILCAQPLFMEHAYPAPPPMPPAPPFTLWSDEDSRATRMILMISGGQALLLGAIAGFCWCRGCPANAAGRKEASRELRRKRPKKPRRTAEPARGDVDEQPSDGSSAAAPTATRHEHEDDAVVERDLVR